jgi:micrococcal nuclease
VDKKKIDPDNQKIKPIKSISFFVLAAFLAFLLATFRLQKTTNIKIIKDFKTSIPEIKEETKTKESKIKVVKVIDGDTIELENGQKVRYIGIDTPELVHPSKPVECFAKEAQEKNKELVLGKEVWLEKDISETDKYGRLLRYVWVNDVLVNEVLVQEGYAQVSTYPPDVKYQERFLEAQRKAREENKGLWNSCRYFGQKVLSSQTEKGCLIKGNISVSGEKIYHLPECGSYDKTVINESKGEKWFCSEEEAILAGFRKAKNCP